MLQQLRSNRAIFSVSVLAITLGMGMVACQDEPELAEPEAVVPEAETEVAAGDADVALEDLDVQLSGASFPAPLYQRWFSAINEEYPGIRVSYQSVGSGAGVEQFLAGTVDFGATDAPLTGDERQAFIAEYDEDPIQVPMTGRAVVFAYNLPEVEQELQLSREAYCGIVTGDVTSWNDPLIASENPEADLSDEPITFVHRSDGSGTTFLFTNHLQEACPGQEAGAAKTVDCPVGMGARGNEGITAQIQQTEGAIGYVEYAYANENNISMAALENQAGNFVEPSPEAAAEVFAGAEVPDDFALTIPDPTGSDAYPIIGLTWLLLYPEYEQPEKAAAIEQVVDWALNQGDPYANELGYVPLPEDVEDQVETTVEELAGV